MRVSAGSKDLRLSSGCTRSFPSRFQDRPPAGPHRWSSAGGDRGRRAGRRTVAATSSRSSTERTPISRRGSARGSAVALCDHLRIAVLVTDQVLKGVPGVDERGDDEEHQGGEDRADGGPDLGVHQAASEASGSASIDGSSVSPRVLVARSAIAPEARTQMLPISSPRWKPEVSACETGAPAESRWLVRLVETAVSTASPSAPPSCCDALRRAAARPALSAGTPALAAVATPTKTPPAPSARTSMPGSRSAR